MKTLKPLRRKLLLAGLSRASPEQLVKRGERLALRAFQRAARLVPAYQMLLAEAGVKTGDVDGFDAFDKYVPLLNKENTFARFKADKLCVPGAFDRLAGVLTSSGHGARFAYGLSTRNQLDRAADDIDLGLEYAFGVDSRKTLLINCLPMGVRFVSNAVTIAETSVREDMVAAIVTELGPRFQQIILVGDPLFFKLLTDHGETQGTNWARHRIHLIIGEETFGEHYRNYLAAKFKLNLDDPAAGLIGSSMGVAELGLNLFYETRQTIRLRRLAHTHPEFFRALFGLTPGVAPLPMLFAYNPLRNHVESVAVDAHGYGQLTVTMTDTKAPLPLVRYQTGDSVRLLSHEHIAGACRSAGIALDENLNLPLISLKGRIKDQLPDGTHVALYKDALYTHHDIAARLTGAFRVEHRNGNTLVHIQLGRGYELDNRDIEKLTHALPGEVTRERLKLWSYEQFPYGMTLDYERKFTYFAE